MTIPQTLAIYTHLNFSHHSILFNFWDRLAGSLYDVDAAYIYAPTTQMPVWVFESSAVTKTFLIGALYVFCRPTAPVMPALPSPETPRITLNGAELTDQPDWKLSEPKAKFKSESPPTESMPGQRIKRRGLLNNLRIISQRNGNTGKPLKHAQSFSAINMPDHENSLNASMSNLSTYSEKKKGFNKISSKLLKPFTRSSTKLQTLCWKIKAESPFKGRQQKQYYLYSTEGSYSTCSYCKSGWRSKWMWISLSSAQCTVDFDDAVIVVVVLVAKIMHHHKLLSQSHYLHLTLHI